MATRKYKKGKKLYKMKGCSRKRRGTRKYLGGDADINLAYPSSNVPRGQNPHLVSSQLTNSHVNSKNIRGGNGCGSINPGVLAYSPSGKGYPAGDPSPSSSGGSPLMNSQTQRGGQRGGACSACSLNNSIIPLNSSNGSQSGGQCSSCNMFPSMSGGYNNGLPYGQDMPPMKGMSYPNGLTGKSWNAPVSKWPGVDDVPGGRNHLAYNKYTPDVSREMKNVGAGPPFLGGKKYRKGGSMSNSLGQDAINQYRLSEYTAKSFYNGMIGKQGPVNPFPWKDQFPDNKNPTALMSKIKF
jgi:hypothetical protein